MKLKLIVLCIVVMLVMTTTANCANSIGLEEMALIEGGCNGSNCNLTMYCAAIACHDIDPATGYLSERATSMPFKICEPGIGGSCVDTVNWYKCLKYTRYTAYSCTGNSKIYQYYYWHGCDGTP